MTASRRNVLIGSAATAVAALSASRSHGQTAAGGPAPGAAYGTGDAMMPSAYRYAIGDITVIAATDGFNPLALQDGFVRNAALADVQAALEAAFLPKDTLNIPFTPMVLRTGSETVLIDTGLADNGPPTAGQLRANMAAAGIDPGAVTKVVISHFHGDHIMGLRDKSGALLYPNAEIMVPEPEWAYWTDDGERSRASERLQGNFALVQKIFGDMGDRLSRYRWGDEVAGGITAVDARGHTPGHTAFVIASGNDRLMMISDVTNHPALFVRNPDWSAVFDMDADQARATRHRVLDMAAAERLQIAGYHFPFPATGHIAREGNGYRLVPVQWMPATP